LRVGPELQIHLAHLVEAERAALRRLDQPRLGAHGAGEGAARMAAQFRCDQACRIAAQLTSTKGFGTRGERQWIIRATSPLPLPVWP
jgi:hypothetical protein